MQHFNLNLTSKPAIQWMKGTLAVLMLLALVPSQPAFAQSVVAETPGAMVTSPTDTTVGTALASSPTVQDVLLSVCQAKGYGQPCAQTLLGMLWNESQNVSTAVGDHGLALGYFQIHYKLHNITTDCATDLVCSATWTLNYMESHDYPQYVMYAVQCHNSCNADNGYAARAVRNGSRLWDEPLAINQSAPITLASAN